MPEPPAVEESLAAALRLLETGRLVEAEQAYLAILSSCPDQHVATLQLGLVAHHRGDDRKAFQLIEKAVQLAPGYAQAHNHLGNALKGEGRIEEALSSYRKAMELAPDYAAPHLNVGAVLLERGETEAAISCFDAALTINPGYAQAHNYLGMARMKGAAPERAVESYRLAVQLKPDFYEAHNNLAVALNELYEPEQALEACRCALALKPDSAELANTEGLALMQLGRFEQAMARFRHAIELKPGYAAPHNNLGTVLGKLERHDEALRQYRTAVELEPGHLAALANLGFSLCRAGELTPAVDSCTRALTFSPGYASAHWARGLTFVAQGRLSEALADFRSASIGGRKHLAAHSNVLLTMNYVQELAQREIYEESRRFDELYCRPALVRSKPHRNVPDPERRLRIGFVSPDFKNHSVSFFFKPLLEELRKRGGAECVCYADVPRPDQVTRELQGLAHEWVDAVGLSDAALAQQVRDDGIDILFDLAAHTGDRMLVFAEKPAPVQVTWLGYPNTTGLSAMDYRLTDAVADPEEEGGMHHSEKLYRMPDGFLCYAPHEEAPAVTPLPAAANGFVTFGSFNNFAKVTPEVVSLWARLLQRVPGSRLIMKGRSFVDLPTRRRCEELFAGHGIEPERVELRPWEAANKGHLEVYGRVDIALDTFPYNGTTTTCEALWMGVPVVTLLGDRHAARVGASILSRLDLDWLVARDQEEYLAIACALAGDLERLAPLRGALRGTMAGSPLCDARSFARHMEVACRDFWRRWCQETKAGADSAAVRGSLSMNRTGQGV